MAGRRRWLTGERHRGELQLAQLELVAGVDDGVVEAGLAVGPGMEVAEADVARRVTLTA